MHCPFNTVLQQTLDLLFGMFEPALLIHSFKLLSTDYYYTTNQYKEFCTKSKVVDSFMIHMIFPTPPTLPLTSSLRQTL